MFLSLLQFFATKFLVLALHLESGSFPRPLSAQEEAEAFAALRAGDPAAREKLMIPVLADGSAEPSVFSYSDCIFLFSLDDAPLME